MRRLTEILTILAVISTPATAIGADDTESADRSMAEVQEIDADQSALPYIAAICGDEASMTSGDEGVHPVCPNCPQGSSADSGSLSLDEGYVGDFSGDGQLEAILATTGCGGGFNFRFSTVVLRQHGDDWQMLEYNDGVGSSSCDPIETPHGARLLCQETVVGQGSASTSVTLRTVADESLTSTSLTRLSDDSGACRYDGEYRQTLEERIVDDLDGDGNVELALRIQSSHGEPVRDDIGVGERCDEDNYEFSETETLNVWKIESGGVTRNDDLAKFIDD